MIVQCENCQTKFKLGDDQVEPEGSWVRCSNCQHVFQVTPDGAPPGGADEEDVQLNLGGQPAPSGNQGDDADISMDMADFGLENEKPEASGGGLGKLFKIVFWLAAALILAAVVVLGGLVAADRMGLAPKTVDMFRTLPGISHLLSKYGAGDQGRRPGDIRIVLQDVDGLYLNSEIGGKLFIIRGELLNQHKEVRTEVLVSAQLLDGKHKVARKAVVYAGHPYNRDVVKNMSLKEIKALLSSPKGPDGSKYVVAPGGTIPFMVVFGNLRPGLKEYTITVVGSQPLPPRR